MSRCPKCTDPACPGGYVGGPAQTWRECSAVLRAYEESQDRWSVPTSPKKSIPPVAPVRRASSPAAQPAPTTPKSTDPSRRDECACGIDRSVCDYHRVETEVTP